MDSPDSPSKRKNNKRRHTPVLEWIASGVGLVLALALIIVIAWDAFTKSGGPPAVVVEAGLTTPFENGFVLEVRVRNVSQATAAEVEIEGVLANAETIVETARARIDYAPGGSVRRAGLFFMNDPHKHVLRLRALGYAEP